MAGKVSNQQATSVDRGEQSLADLLEQVTRTLDEGGEVDLEGLVTTHPKYADKLRELMPTMLAMATWGQTPKVDEANHSPPCPAQNLLGESGVLGDFRILRELGRGGMGTVYEAEQISMGRRVALKVLPFAALAHENALNRFRNEVRAAAALDHPHIVSIYSVGEERGVHYYAMQLIRGQSLAELVWQTRLELGSGDQAEAAASGASLVLERACESEAATRAYLVDSLATTPGEHQARLSTAIDSRRDRKRYRTAARLGIQAAEALQHAHEQGVLHRDIKPGNLMLDATGELSITDFGLARIEAEAGMTMTGDIVGTLRYMPPEQALGKRVVIDHRADVYSLGATLYELLALRPPFEGTDRGELLKQIAFEDPKPIRKIDRHIPVDLETIVLKAIAKSPDERYQTVQHLAEDLRAYLDHQPITAKPPSLLGRTAKWSQRNTRVLWTMLAGLMITLIISICSTVIFAQLTGEAQRQRRTADEERALAERERRRAEVLLGKMQLQRGIRLLATDQSIGMVDLVDARLSAGDHAIGNAAARLWAAAMDICDATLISVEPGAQYVQFNADGSYFVNASGSSAFVWETASGDKVAGPFELDEFINTVTFSPNGSLIAAHSLRGIAQVWDVASGQPISPSLRTGTKSLKNQWSKYPTAAFSPDGALFATVGLDGKVWIWDVATWNPYCAPFEHHSSAWSLAFRPDGKYLATQSEHNVLKIWDITEKSQYGQDIPCHCNAHGNPLVFSPDNRWLLHKDDQLMIWITNAQKFEPHKKLGYNRTLLLGGAFSPDGTLLATATSDWFARLWNSETGQQVGEAMKHQTRVNSVAFSPDGNRLATGTLDGKILIWDTKTQRKAGRVLYQDGPVLHVAFSPTGKHLAATGSSSTRVWQVDKDLNPATPLREIERGGSLRTVMSIDGSCSVTVSDRGDVEFQDGDSNTIDSEFNNYQAVVRCAAFSPDSRLLATGYDEWELRIWEVPTGRLIRKWRTPDRTYGIAFSPVDRTLLATAHMDGTARLWNAANGQQIGSPLRHENQVWEIAFDPSGKMLASTSGQDYLRPTRIHLWDISSAAPHSRIKLPFLPLQPRYAYQAYSSTLAQFDTVGKLRVKKPGDDQVYEWLLPKAPTDPYAMRRTTWHAIGMRRDLDETEAVISVREWRKLHRERSQ